MNREKITVKFLLVEDNQAFADILIEFLSEDEYLVTHCTTAEQAICLLEQQSFDLILSDIKLPGKLTGWDIANAAPKKPQVTLLLLMTAYSEMEAAEKAFNKGVYDFLSKPFNLFELKMRLANAVRYQHLLRLNASIPKEQEKLYSTVNEDGFKRRLDERFAEATYQKISWEGNHHAKG